MKITIKKHRLIFKQAAGTSRGVLLSKDTWFIKVFDAENPLDFGIGEINMFKGLSYDDRPDFYSKLNEIIKSPEHYILNMHKELIEYPSIIFGLETALLDYKRKQNKILFPSKFTEFKAGIPINGLIWMGNQTFMKQQIKQKLDSGFRCLKMKIGAIDFETELNILKKIREEYQINDLEIRVDANGAFNKTDAFIKLDQLSFFQIHSIEQPIKPGDWDFMHELSTKSSLSIALDEELIGIHHLHKKELLLNTIKPQYIILKPALIGGFKATQEWINLAINKGIGWWITSALESNIGLNAIAQYTYQLKTDMYHGLGTGQLFSNNIDSPLIIKHDKLYYQALKGWGKC